MSSSNHPRVRQMEIWDDKALSLKLMEAMFLVIFGEVPDQKHGLAIFMDVVQADMRMARRVMRIMEATPRIMKECPELYETCQMQVRSGLAAPGKQ